MNFIASRHDNACAARMRPGRLVLLAVAAVALLAGVPVASAMPSPAAPMVERGLPVVRVLTTCDTRGCFTFGPRQRYTRPDTRPSDQTGPNYYRPNAAGPPHYIQRPPPGPKRPQLRLPPTEPNAHRQGCINRYRSYDPRTDRYLGAAGRPTRCLLR